MALTGRPFEIVAKTVINPDITRIEVLAPRIAAKARAGQFVILRSGPESERIPLTIAGADRERGTVELIFQKVGKATLELGALSVGEALHDLVGPLGLATHIEGVQRAAVVGGGLGCAIAYPVARALFAAGARVDMIAGFRSKDLVILEEELRAASTRWFLCTDDGSAGFHGFVTDQLKALIEAGEHYDRVYAFGPLPMMKFVSLLTKQYGIPTTVSMNPIMVDGTGMCGGCRVTVGGKVRFACVDGPDFDGHQVDFDETMRRNAAYREFEQQKAHACRLGLKS